jgi:cytochrome P450
MNGEQVPNVWAMCHDPAVYPSPSTFDPERFLGSSPQPDPRELVFGFGRRRCPGMHLAEASIFVQMATLLATVDMSSKATDVGHTTGLAS